MLHTLPNDCVLIAHPMRDGSQVLVARSRRPRSCVRLDGVEKVTYADRADARRGCPKHEIAYRCRHCASWHRATKAPTSLRRPPAVPIARVRRFVA